jgi:hypothetical protein
MSSNESGAANAVRGIFSTLILLAGIIVLLFGVFLAYEAQAVTWDALVDFLIGAVLIVVSGWM